MDKIKDNVSKYYDEKVSEFGDSHWGVDWNSVESQELRFKQLLKVTDSKGLFTLLDYGCGFGSLYNYLRNNNFKVDKYYGFDISTKMIELAIKKNNISSDCQWINSLPISFNVDYSVASGIFNVKQDTTSDDWYSYIISTLDKMNTISKKGFSFNLLTSYSDVEFKKDYLYYSDPLSLFDYCKRNYSKEVALLHDYGLYEFTLLIRK